MVAISAPDLRCQADGVSTVPSDLTRCPTLDKKIELPLHLDRMLAEYSKAVIRMGMHQTTEENMEEVLTFSARYFEQLVVQNSKPSWPELEGTNVDVAVDTIKEQAAAGKVNVDEVVKVPEGAFVTQDYSPNRVRVYYDESTGIVVGIPTIG